jgi:hypothetical protein
VINLKLSAIDVDRRQLFIKNAKGRQDRVLEMLKSQFVTERNTTFLFQKNKPMRSLSIPIPITIGTIGRMGFFVLGH